MKTTVKSSKIRKTIKDISVLFDGSFSRLKKEDLLEEQIQFEKKEIKFLTQIIKAKESNSRDHSNCFLYNNEVINHRKKINKFIHISKIERIDKEYGHEFFIEFLSFKYPKLKNILNDLLNDIRVIDFIKLDGSFSQKELMQNHCFLKNSNFLDPLYITLKITDLNHLLKYAKQSESFSDLVTSLTPTLQNINERDSELIKDFNNWFVSYEDKKEDIKLIEMKDEIKELQKEKETKKEYLTNLEHELVTV